ncbi:MAG: YifB family Mg chelatase-like AAA ATPase [Gemmatimonadales bacterium]|nr:MAG: YifB family Mg chelatase-like AAA ATPase [Gemmatimonadales bacterium]
MLTRVRTAGLLGVDALPVTVEVGLTSGLPTFTVVGLPQSAVREGRERVLSALRHLGVALPPQRITVNLAPADQPKEGTGFDLPLAVALLVAAGAVTPDAVRDMGFTGELGLDGRIRPIRGVLSRALGCREAGARELVVPHANLREAKAVPGLTVRWASDLGELRDCLNGEREWPASPRSPSRPCRSFPPDLADVRGQALARRALEVAAAGGHNLLLVGSPGVGKTLLARRLPGLLPPLSRSEAVEVTRVLSAVGQLPEGAGLVRDRPFRAPHHSVSDAGLIGGGSPPRPGEVTLAHRGVLFLDELPEFRRRALELLRQPLESGSVRLARARGAFEFPARVTLVAAMNPCPCGFLGHPSRECRCGPAAIERYRGRVSGPLLDRIDLQVTVSPVVAGLWEGPPGEGTQPVRERVRRARDRQRGRFGETGPSCNAEMDPALLREHVEVPRGVAGLLQRAQDRLGLSPRAYHRLLKVARTLADLEGVDGIREEHAAEAIHFRELDRPVR